MQALAGVVSSNAHRYERCTGGLNVKEGVVSTIVPVGPPIVGAGGGVESTVHVYESAGPVSGVKSVACTWNVWLPSPTVYDFGEVHAENPPPSSWHSNVASAFVELKVNVGVVSLVGSAGLEPIETSGPAAPA